VKVQKKLFSLVDSWPWLVITLLVALLNVAAFRYNWHADWASGPVGVQLGILALVSVIFLLLTTYHYHLREGFVFAWNNAFQAATGVAIMVDDAATILMLKADVINGSSDTSLKEKIAIEIDKCVLYWSKWYTTYSNTPGVIAVPSATCEAAAASRMDNALVGQTILVVAKPPIVNFIGKVMGFSDGANIVVTFDGDRVASEAALLQLIRHEVSHVCLSAAGIDAGYAGTKHHDIFAQTGYC
jgi:hypothetical protein